MHLRARFLASIGLLATLVGMWVLNNPLDEEALPINQLLFAFDAALMVAWTLVGLARGRG